MASPAPLALVTGASRGLGRGIALALAREGFSVYVNYAHNLPAAEETARLCSEQATNTAQKFVPLHADVASQEDRQQMLRRVFDEEGDLVALVNNAGIAPRVRADILEANEASFEELMRTNLQGPYFLTQQIARRWLEVPAREGLPRSIVFITSISAYTASTGRGEYCVAKAGLSMARQLWAARLAGEGIGVYEVRPGIMATDMTSGVRSRYDTLIAEGLVPQRRWGSAEDVGKAVAALIRGDFAFSTGTVVDVDGGFSLRTL
jgi:NAD(P)-dependent dehydrogenase (short-subunit alcohol dehydrogenase family)